MPREPPGPSRLPVSRMSSAAPEPSAQRPNTPSNPRTPRPKTPRKPSVKNAAGKVIYVPPSKPRIQPNVAVARRQRIPCRPCLNSVLHGKRDGESAPEACIQLLITDSRRYLLASKG
jgi:hypothetical protein